MVQPDESSKCQINRTLSWLCQLLSGLHCCLLYTKPNPNWDSCFPLLQLSLCVLGSAGFRLLSLPPPFLVYPDILLKPGLKKSELFSIKQSLPFTPKYLLRTLPLMEQVRACLLFFLFLAALVLCGPWRATRPEERAALISACCSCVQRLLGQAGPFTSERGPANPKEQEEMFLLLVYFWQNRNSSAAEAVLPGWGWEQEVEPDLLRLALGYLRCCFV